MKQSVTWPDDRISYTYSEKRPRGVSWVTPLSVDKFGSRTGEIKQGETHKQCTEWLSLTVWVLLIETGFYAFRCYCIYATLAQLCSQSVMNEGNRWEISIMLTVDFFNEELHQGELKKGQVWGSPWVFQHLAIYHCNDNQKSSTSLSGCTQFSFFTVNELAVFCCQGRDITGETYLTA